MVEGRTGAEEGDRVGARAIGDAESWTYQTSFIVALPGAPVIGACPGRAERRPLGGEVLGLTPSHQR